MAQYHVLYNPLSCNGNGEKPVERLKEYYPDDSLSIEKITEIKDMAEYLTGLPEEDKVILCGGDGTLNRFANDIQNITLKNEVLFFPTGTGNDFAREFEHERESKPFAVNEYITNLPVVTVNGKQTRFINGVGYGIDGYCCEVGDKMRLAGEQKINYAGIAIKGLLFHYKPTDATVTVDGVKHTYKKVWLAPTMKGKYYGGGMIPTPAQKRESDKLSVLIFHGSGKLKTLMIFPNIFKGEHVKETKYVEVLEGKEITVEFDRPTPLQIDGETVLGVTSYTATV